MHILGEERRELGREKRKRQLAEEPMAVDSIVR